MSEEFKKIQWVISEEDADQRIDKALANHPEIRSRSRASLLLKDGLILLNGKKLKASYSIAAGEELEINIPIEKKEVLEATDIPLDIVFEDEDIIIINKNAGLVVHPATSHQNDTLVNALLAHTKDLSMGFNEERPGIVHRLDKDTSGLLVVAKNDSSHARLAQQFKDKSTHRIYWALAYGEPKPSEGKIESFLNRHAKDRKKYASAANGKEAITHYKTLKTSPSGISWIQLQLETGRTHQIRVHLSEKGHAIIGDNLYGNSGRVKNLKSVALRKKIQELPRFALHATELGFKHPTSNKEMFFKSPWPEDLLDLLESCGLNEI